MKITIQDARTSVTLQQRDFRVTISGARGPAGPQGEAGASEWGDIGGTLSNQTDLQTALNAKVPYTGATQDVNLGEYGAQIGNLEFDNTPTNVPTAAGSVYWNDTDGTLNLVLKGGQTISRIGETQHIRALNNTGAQIARGKVVYVVGAQGQRLTIALADADTEILSKDTIGFTAEAIADGAEGFVIVQGVINNVSTTGMTDGATVYLSQTAGSYTTTAPADPAHMVVLGFIVNGGSGGAGSIYVKVDNGYELEELHGVADAAKVTPVGADALLLRDSADNNLWKRLTWTNALAGVKSHMDTFKSVANGYASLDGSGKVPSSELPSYVDDVVEAASFAALPGTGETGKIYVTLDTNKCYRWTGSVYVQVSQGVDTLTTTGTSGAATLVGSTLNIPQYQGVLTNPVTGTGTAGQVAYFNGTSAVTGSSSLVFDGTRLGIGRTPSARRVEMQQAVGSVAAAFGIFDSGGTVQAVMGTETASTTDFQLASVAALRFYSGSTIGNIVTNPTNERLRITSAGNVLIGNTDGTGRLTVRGSGTTSATTALLVQDSTPTDLFKVQDNGVVSLNFISRLNSTLQLYGQSGAVTGILLRSIASSETATSGVRLHVRVNESFAPTSGTCVLNTLQVDPVINQTGGANGITRGLYVNPILTAAADWRSVEFSNNTGWGLYGAGTAANYLAGNTSIGTTTSSGRLTVQGSGTTSATKAFVVNNATPTALLEILDNGRINQTIPGATSNTIFGTNAGASASLSGSYNTYFGVNVGQNNTTAAGNTLIGSGAGANVTTGGSNIYIGRDAGAGNQTATTNTAVGTFAMLNHTTGGNNITKGFNAARYYADGTTNAVSFSECTYLGTSTRVSGAGVTNEIAIGTTAIGNGSNTATFGNTSITATYLRGNINYTDGGNFVIGTTTGTKIGTATTQKLSFWGATPIVQPTTGIAEATFVENSGGTAVNVDSTFAGYTIQQIAQALKDIGILA